MVLLLLIMAVLPCALSKATIETKQLFLNTIKRWNIDIVSKSDHAERYRRFVKAQVSVDATTSGVMLTSLNKHTVMNDEEFDSTIGAVDRANRAYNWNNTMVNEEKTEFYQQRQFKRGAGREQLQIEKRGELPESFTYWEDWGFKDAVDQASCSSCYAFPGTGAIEAVYKYMTGEAVEFSEQYFVDCTTPNNGCGGNTVKSVFEITKKRQYMRSAELSPYKASYKGCNYRDEIASFTNNALKKLWLVGFYPIGGSERNMLHGLFLSPVSFVVMVSDDLYSYSGGLFEDTGNGVVGHAMLLVGYTETALRVRNSYGVDFGENGYINFKRGSPSLISTNFYNHAYVIDVDYRRDYQYEFCNNKRVATRAVCEASCKAMNTDTESGWTLAVIPTEYHNNLVLEMVEAVYPGVKTWNDDFNYLWIGFENNTSIEGGNYFDRADGERLYYISGKRRHVSRRYGVINKNTGDWRTRGSTTVKLRGLCSRTINCWNMENYVMNGVTTFTDASLKEGTRAEVTCEKGYTLVGYSSLVCTLGRWDAVEIDSARPYIMTEEIPWCRKDEEV